MHSYRLLERVLKEQCKVNLTDNKNSVDVKRPKEILSDSPQNPSDLDATYSGNKGQGYPVQVMETYCKDEDVKEKSLNLITHVQVAPIHESDANALIPVIESTRQRSLAPEEILADSLYGSDENLQEAKQLGVEAVAPTMGSKKESSISLSDFEVTEKETIVSCQQGHKPIRTKKRKSGTL